MIKRRIKQQVVDGLDRQAAVALIGPRQVGKTTLAQAITDERGGLCLDLEDRDDRAKLSNAALFFRQFEDRLVILDEIHRVPELFQTLRGVIDEGRRKGKRTGRFLILGSASIDLLRQSGEGLAGRIEYIDLQSFDVTEVGTSHKKLERLWIQGGFPDSYLAKNEVASLKLRKSFVRTYLERCTAVWAENSSRNVRAIMDDAGARAGNITQRIESCFRIVADFSNGHKVHRFASGSFAG